jgi:DNA-binding winged helix-turn-helix (wHTH) protein/tetratricopeptide (TPR) repeat protein
LQTQDEVDTMMNAHKLLRFGNCEVNALRHEVWRDGQLQPAAPKVFGLLVYLLQERHRVVQRDELLDAIWQGQDVSDSVLARTIMQARKLIGDSASQPTCIKTVHGHGYRVVGEVFESAAPLRAAAPAAAPAPTPPAPVPAAQGGRLRLGMLPCQNQTGDAALDWTQYGLMTLVGHALEGDPRLDVVPVSTMQEALGKLPVQVQVADRIQLALQSLGLNRVVHASIRRQGHAFWLDYQIAGAGEHTISGNLREADAVQMGERLACAINADLFPGSGMPVGFESRDPFVNQTFARAIEQYVQSHFDSAVRMMAVVCDMEPHSTVAQLWHLRLRALTGDATVRDAGEALLGRAREAGDVRLQANTHQIIGFAIGSAEGPVEAARVHLNAALALAEGQGDADWVTLIRANLAEDAKARGNIDLARELFRQAETAFRASGNSLHLGPIQYSLAQLAWQAGDSAEAQLGFEGALGTLRETRRDALAMQTLARLGEANAAFGLYRLAESQCKEALASIGRIQNTHAAAAIVGHAAGVLASRGGAAEVERAFEHAAPMSRDPRPGVRGPLAVAQGWLDFLRGDRAELRQRAIALAADKRMSRADVYSLLALWLRAEDLSQDTAAIEQARALISQYAECAVAPYLWGVNLLSRARESCAQGDIGAAIASLTRIIESRPFGQLHSIARLNAAWLHLERGDLVDARPLLDDAGAWSTEHPAGLATQARLAWAQGDAAQAVSLQRRAMSTFRGPAARWHQLQLDAYLSNDASIAMPEMPRLISESFFPVMR